MAEILCWASLVGVSITLVSELKAGCHSDHQELAAQCYGKGGQLVELYKFDLGSCSELEGR